MLPFESSDLDSLLLEKFPLEDQRIYFRGYTSRGGAGYPFRVRINKKKYAYKIVG